MSSPAKPKPETILGVTMNDAKLLLLGILATSDMPKPDYEKFARMGNYTPGSASVVYRKALKRLAENNPDVTSAATASAEGTPVKKATGKRGSTTSTPAKVKEEKSGDDDVDDDPDGAAEEIESPKKRQKKTPEKRTPKKGIARKVNKKDKVQANSDDDDADYTTTPSKAKAKPRGKAATAAAVKKEESPPVKDEDSDMDMEIKPDESMLLTLPGDDSIEKEIENMDVSPGGNGEAVVEAVAEVA